MWYVVIDYIAIGTWGPIKGLRGQYIRAYRCPKPYSFMENWHPSHTLSKV